MNIVDRLTSELMKLRDSDESPQSDPSLTERYKTAARNYAFMENTVSVLSDLKSNVSHIYYGRFAETLGIGNRPAGEETIDSIWERRIMELIQPNDLYDKHLNELRFFHFIRHLPKSRRADYYLVNKLRMRNRFGNIVPAVHRLFYISDPANNGLWFALCLYGPMTFEFPGTSAIVNSATGQIIKHGEDNAIKILTKRETEVLKMISRGMTSKQIAEGLSISINTVNRHRQEILGKLQVRNSIEACRVAEDLGLL